MTGAAMIVAGATIASAPADIVNATRKRKGSASRSCGCPHLPRNGEGNDDSGRDVWLRVRLQSKLVAATGSALVLDPLCLRADEPRDLRTEICVCLSCDFAGTRESALDPERCFMTHAILTNHHCALLPLRRQVYCTRCQDFVYPDALLGVTQVVTSSSCGSSMQLTDRSRGPALRRRLLRSSARRGLVNMGNTCYMNAVLQALAHNPLLQHEYFVLRSHNMTICEQKRRHLQQRSQSESVADAAIMDRAMLICLGCEMSALLQTLLPAPRAAITRHHLSSPVVPQAFLEAFWTLSPHFANSQQQDSHEFLMTLLNGIHKHTHARVAPVATHGEHKSALMSPRFSAAGHSLCDCIVHQSFSGVFQSAVTCAFCKNVSGTHDPFLDVSLSLEGGVAAEDAVNGDDGEPRVSLVSLLRHFTAEERLKGKNQVYCRPCRRYVDASKRLVIQKLPNLLVLHLKRLDFHKHRKIPDLVSFPTGGLDLGEFCDGYRSRDSSKSKHTTRDAVYDLAAVINHHGDSVEGGHFTAYVHAIRDDPDECAVPSAKTGCATRRDFSAQWLLFDDSEVTPVTTERVRRSQAYILLYVRRRLFG